MAASRSSSPFRKISIAGGPKEQEKRKYKPLNWLNTTCLDTQVNLGFRRMRDGIAAKVYVRTRNYEPFPNSHAPTFAL